MVLIIRESKIWIYRISISLNYEEQKNKCLHILITSLPISITNTEIKGYASKYNQKVNVLVLMFLSYAAAKSEQIPEMTTTILLYT